MPTSQPPNPQIQLLTGRASCRNSADRPVPAAVLEEILEAGIHGPSGGNLQPYSIIAVRNAATRRRLAEAAVDLSLLAGLSGVTAICEIVRPDGGMARYRDLRELADRESLALISVGDLIAYRRRTEKLVVRDVAVHLPTEFGEFQAVDFRETLTGKQHVALVMGELDGAADVLVRVHSECLTGDVFHSLRCDCGERAATAFDEILVREDRNLRGRPPGERREIERGLREGRVRGVVATNALELGIDIGSLDACVMAGYAGSIASTWQRAGRAGRRSGTSCAVLVASSAPLDQFIVQHPDYFFGRSPEHAYVQPDNLEILVNHLKCAAFELPIAPEERFGSANVAELCERLSDAGFLHRSGGNWHWVQEAYPADTVSLRSVTSDNFVIIDTNGDERGKAEVIGEVDFSSALTTVHEKAIYLQDGQQYHVERLDYQERKAYVRQCDSEYYTDAISYTKIKILENFDSAPAGPAIKNHGEVRVNTQVVGFKKIKFFTNENVGAGELQLPENEMHTTSFWITLERALVAALPYPVSERQAGMYGLLHALEAVATLLLMCDPRDLGTAIGERPRELGSPDAPLAAEELASGGGREVFEPNLYLYDAYPGGIGFSEPLFQLSNELLARTRELIRACACENGGPSCVGPAESGMQTKEVALAILDHLCR